MAATEKAGCLGRFGGGGDVPLTLSVDAGRLADAEHCLLPTSVVRERGVRDGQQVRLGVPDRGECALYTAVGTADAATVTAAGADRAGLEPGAEIVVDTAVGTTEDSPYDGTFTLDGQSGGSRVVVLAPHGGDIEPGTAVQARRLAEEYGATAWWCEGTWPDGNPFDRWHVASTDLHPASFPALADLAEAEHDYAVAFHGAQVAGVAVGGGAPDALRARVIDALERALPADVEVRPATRDRYRGTDPANVVNRVAEAGVQLEQGGTARTEHPVAIADAVADALE